MNRPKIYSKSNRIQQFKSREDVQSLMAATDTIYSNYLRSSGS